MLYLQILEKLLKEWEIKKPQYAQLVRVSESLIQEIKSLSDEQQVVPSKGLENEGNVPSDKINNNDISEKSEDSETEKCPKTSIDSEKFYIPLELACQGDSPRIAIIALDGLQKLLAHGELTGNYANPLNPNKRLIDRIVETICTCFKGAETDEAVELQVIKALLTIVTSQNVQIHEGSLLLTLRTSFMVYLQSKNSINQATSKAMLTQMLHSIFTRMEFSTEGGLAQDESFRQQFAETEDKSFWFEKMELFPINLVFQKSVNATNDATSEVEAISKDDNFPGPSEKSETQYSSVLQKDAFLLFWAVCKLALKPNATEDDAELGFEQKSRTLAFQLLKSVLENCGPIFQTNPMFVTAVKQYLCGAIISIGISPSQEIYQLSIDLLLLSVEKFRTSIAEEIEAVIQSVILPALEQSDNSSGPFSPDHRLLALKAIHKFYSNFNWLVDIYQKKEPSENGVFGRMILATCKLITSEPEAGPLPSLPLRLYSIEGVVELLKNMSNFLDRKKDSDSGNTDKEICDNSNENETIDETHNSLFVNYLINYLRNLPESLDISQVDIKIQEISQHLYDVEACGDNLESADAIYSLMYSSISLIAELSCKMQGKRKATKDWFVSLNQNQTATSSLWFQPFDKEFVESVYDEIEAYLKQHDEYRKRRNECEQTEPQSLTQGAKRLSALIRSHHPPMINEKQIRCIKKMFKIMGKNILGPLVGTLFMCDDTTLTDMCLAGMQYAIHITAVLNLKNEKDAFVQALARLSTEALKAIKAKTANALVVTRKTSSATTTENGVTKTTITTTTETKCSSQDKILAMLNVALNEGNYLGNTWLDALKCISQLEAADLMGERRSRRNPYQNSGGQERKSWYEWAGSFVPTFWDNSGTKLDVAVVKESFDACVHKIFLNSTKLDDKGIIDFFKALCQISLIEITHPENPRSFVYEKIFEVAYANVQRPCVQWCGIWQVLADFFSHLACSSDEDVSFFALDSITKLVGYFLEKETLGIFRFQSHFLKPFETVMHNTQFVSTREYVLASIRKIVQNHAAQIRSGWIFVYRILETSIYNDDIRSSEESFDMFKSIVEMFSEEEGFNLSSSYRELLRSLSYLSFKAPRANVEKEALHLIRNIASLIHRKPEVFLPIGSQDKALLWTHGWLPFFTELSNVILASEKMNYTVANQAGALTIIFEIIKEYGDSFDKAWWEQLFSGTLFEIFQALKIEDDAVMTDPTLTEGKGYSQFYCYYYVQFAVVDSFIRYFHLIGDNMLEKLLKELEWCIIRDHEQIALSAVQSLHQIVRMLLYKLTTSQWSFVINMLQTILKPSTEGANAVVQMELVKIIRTILLPPKNEENVQEEIQKLDSSNTNDCVDENTKKDNQEMHQTIEPRNTSYSIDNETLFSILETLEKCLQDGQKMQSDKPLEKEISTLHILQESLLLDTFLRFITGAYFDKSIWSNEEMVKVEKYFNSGVNLILGRYVEILQCPENGKHLQNITEAVQILIPKLSHHNFPETKVLGMGKLFYSRMCDLLELELDPELSTVLAKYFLKIIRLKIGETNNDSECI